MLDVRTAAALASLLYASKEEGIRVAASQLLGVIPNAIAPLCEMLTHQDPEAQIMAAKMLEHLLDPSFGGRVHQCDGAAGRSRHRGADAQEVERNS